MEQDRHAYCIMAHNQPKLLQVLIEMIDDERNDIYVLIDAKADTAQFSSIRTQKSKIFYTKRIKVYWGNYSIVRAEILLLETAHSNGPYLYYHLLSGVDLPLKSQDYIHHLLDDVYRGHEFVGFARNQPIDERVRYYYFFDNYFRDNTWKGKYLGIFMNRCIALQKRLGIWRNRNTTFYKGSAWISITDDFCRYLLNNKKRIRKYLKYTLIPDECCFQTIIHDSLFYDKVHNKDDEYLSCMRLIDWEKEPGNSFPHTWERQDMEELFSRDRLFARKFTDKDMDFINEIKRRVLSY